MSKSVVSKRLMSDLKFKKIKNGRLSPKVTLRSLYDIYDAFFNIHKFLKREELMN